MDLIYKSVTSLEESEINLSMLQISVLYQRYYSQYKKKNYL